MFGKLGPMSTANLWAVCVDFSCSNLSLCIATPSLMPSSRTIVDIPEREPPPFSLQTSRIPARSRLMSSPLLRCWGLINDPDARLLARESREACRVAAERRADYATDERARPRSIEGAPTAALGEFSVEIRGGDSADALLSASSSREPSEALEWRCVEALIRRISGLLGFSFWTARLDLWWLPLLSRKYW